MSFENLYSDGISKWHLRVGVTPGCNFRCVYCLPKGVSNHSMSNVMSQSLVTKLVRASGNIGMKRIHWTGGEPTTCEFLPIVIEEGKKAGISQQIITTNGSLFSEKADEYKHAGLTRVIISIDSLKRERFRDLVGVDCLDKVLKSITTSVNLFESMTKLSVVTMKTTLSELGNFLDLAHNINSSAGKDRLAIKLNQFFPCNPAQLTEDGQEYWQNEFVESEEIVAALEKLGKLEKIDRKTIEGDNPSYQYYRVGGANVVVAVLSLFSWGYPCGGCFKLRVSPQGFLSVCINQKDVKHISDETSEEELVMILRELINFRQESRFEEAFPNRNHYRGQLGELRFGTVGTARNREFFAELLKSKRQSNT